MSNLVEVVVDNLTQVNEHILLDLNFGVLIDLDSGGVHDTQVTDEVLAIFTDNHQLRLPELLVVGDLVVVSVTFTNLENTGVTVKSNTETLNLLSVDSLELKVKFVCCSLVGDAVERSSLHGGKSFFLGIAHLLKADFAKELIVLESLQLGLSSLFKSSGELLDLRSTMVSTSVGLHLSDHSVEAGVVNGDFINKIADLLSVTSNGEDIVVFGGTLFVGGQVLFVCAGTL